MHPYEFAPDELRELTDPFGERLPIPWRMRLHQGLGRRSFPDKINTLLRSARFDSIAGVLAERQPLAVFRYEAGGRIVPTNVITSGEARIREAPGSDAAVTAPQPMQQTGGVSGRPHS